MNIRLQLVDHQSRPFPAGFEFTLLANGEELARGTSDAEGVVSFDTGAEVREGLSVRLDAWPAAAEAAATLLRPESR